MTTLISYSFGVSPYVANKWTNGPTENDVIIKHLGKTKVLVKSVQFLEKLLRRKLKELHMTLHVCKIL